MPALNTELEMEAFLLRIIPGLSTEWKGSTPDEIAQIEQIAGQPLPSFYRWFLTRMGQSMGPLAYPTLDFSARRVLTHYARSPAATPPRLLLIGHESNDLMPLHVHYDFETKPQDDAPVAKRHEEGGEVHYTFETFREMLAWGAFLRFCVGRMPQQCEGLLTSDAPGLLSRLDPLLIDLGFTKSISTGPFCGLYERADAAMVCSCHPVEGFDHSQVFTIGGSSAGVIKRILGELRATASLEVEIDEWSPGLA